MNFTHWIAAGFALLAVILPVRAQTTVLGDWHGVLQSPIGPLTLIITIAAGENGVLRGEMESVDQRAPRTPLTSITWADDRLTFSVRPAQIVYEGKWAETEQHWSGTLTQGTQTPLTLRRGLPPARPRFEELDGVWEAGIKRNGVDLRLLIRITTSRHGSIITLDSPDLGAFGLPVTTFSRREQSVQFFVPASAAAFTGSLSDDRSRFSGKWTLPGQPDAEIAFIRKQTAERELRARPQTPRPPFPYREETVAFKNAAADSVTLAGTLTIPEGTGPFPAAVLVTGSGPQDRDETIFGHKPFAVIADHLARQGVAVLRYDDRGVGRSTGSFDAATSADFATDAAAAVRFLLTRTEIDRDGIGFIGHSEGGMVAPIAAAGNNNVAFLILLAGPGTDLTQLLHSQQRLLGLSQGASEADLVRMEPVMTGIYTAVAKTASAEDARIQVRRLLTADVLATLRVPELRREMLVQQLANDWFRYFLQYEPAAFLSRIHVPVLALNGALDRQVPADENLAAIKAALAHNPDVTIRRLEGLNHMFQTAETGAIGEYADIAETISPDVLRIVTEWIEARFKRNKSQSVIP